jgi:hypothetical protein
MTGRVGEECEVSVRKWYHSLDQIWAYLTATLTHKICLVSAPSRCNCSSGDSIAALMDCDPKSEKLHVVHHRHCSNHVSP